MVGRFDRSFRYVACLVAVCLFLSLGSSVFAQEEQSTISPYQLLTEFTILNIEGVTVYFRKTTTDACGIAALMEAGIGDESQEETHCAHIAEHMVLRYPVNNRSSLADMIMTREAAQVAYYNGHTDLDSTQYCMSTLNSSLPSVLTAFLKALFSPSLAKGSAWDAEIKRVAREVNNLTTRDAPATIHRMRSALLKGTPYADLLFETPVSSVKPEAVTNFMRREYTPSRLTLVVVGDWDEKDIVEAIKSGLGEVEYDQPPAYREITISPDEYSTLHLPSVEMPRVSIGVGVDGIAPEDRPALLALWTMVAARLQAGVQGFTPKGAVTVTTFPMKAASAAMFSVVPDTPADDETLKSIGAEAMAAVRQVLNDFAKGCVKKEELDFTVTEPDPDAKAVMEKLYAEMPSALKDAITIVGFAIPEMNSSDRSIPEADDLEEALIAEAGLAAAKYTDRMRFTILYTIQGFSLKRILTPIALVVIVLVAFLYVRFRKRPTSPVPDATNG